MKDSIYGVLTFKVEENCPFKKDGDRKKQMITELREYPPKSIAFIQEADHSKKKNCHESYEDTN